MAELKRIGAITKLAGAMYLSHFKVSYWM